MYIEFVVKRVNEMITSIYKRKKKRRDNEINKGEECVDKFN